MQILIETECPHCKRKVVVYSKSKKEKKPDNYYDIVRLIHVKDDKKAEKIDEMFRQVVEEKNEVKPDDRIDGYFREFEVQLHVIDDKKELLKLKKHIKELKMQISKEMLKKFDERKKDLMKKIDLTIKNIGKKPEIPDLGWFK